MDPSPATTLAGGVDGDGDGDGGEACCFFNYFDPNKYTNPGDYECISEERLKSLDSLSSIKVFSTEV